MPTYTIEDIKKMHEEELARQKESKDYAIRARRDHETENYKANEEHSTTQQAAKVIGAPFEAAYNLQKKAAPVIKETIEAVKSGVKKVAETIGPMLPKNRTFSRDENYSSPVRPPTADEQRKRDAGEKEFEETYQ